MRVSPKSACPHAKRIAAVPQCLHQAPTETARPSSDHRTGSAGRLHLHTARNAVSRSYRQGSLRYRGRMSALSFPYGAYRSVRSEFKPALPRLLPRYRLKKPAQRWTCARVIHAPPEEHLARGARGISRDMIGLQAAGLAQDSRSDDGSVKTL